MEEFIDTLIDANKRCREAFTAMEDQYNAAVEHYAIVVDPDLSLNSAISKLHHSYNHVESVSNDMSDLMDLARQLLALNTNAVGPTAPETVPDQEHNINIAAPHQETVEHNPDLPDHHPNKND